VRQRLALSDLGAAADTLVMSATPIPRSLALTIYGDLDLTVLDELPPGRQRIRTALRAADARARVYEFIREQVGKGRQAYVVYPLVEESEKIDLKAATAEFKNLSKDVFNDLRVGLLHGQLAGDEKDATMRAFAAGEIDILVATTVIEVGIDVANASVMVVEHAERFGLSQLHQLRGRVGRGADQSYCILIWEGGDEAYQRLKIFEQSEDGFEIARADLQLRGMGDFFGARQHGLPDFRFFDVEFDEDLLARARNAARSHVARDPDLRLPENKLIRQQLERRYGERARLYDVG
jgi:ATP-dependent DNA helicase RecG